MVAWFYAQRKSQKQKYSTATKSVSTQIMGWCRCRKSPWTCPMRQDSDTYLVRSSFPVQGKQRVCKTYLLVPYQPWLVEFLIIVFCASRPMKQPACKPISVRQFPIHLSCSSWVKVSGNWPIWFLCISSICNFFSFRMGSGTWVKSLPCKSNQVIFCKSPVCAAVFTWAHRCFFSNRAHTFLHAQKTETVNV